MANANFHLRRITRKGKDSAAAMHRYICCAQEFSVHRPERLHVEHSNLPDWTEGQATIFWESVDTYERQRARLATMLTAALPRTLTLEEQKTLVRNYLTDVFEDTKVLTWGIHAPQASDGHPQPHLHALYSLRTLDGIERAPEHFFKQYNAKAPELGGAQKDLWYESDDALYQMHKLWDAHVAQALVHAETPPLERPAVPAHAVDLPQRTHDQRQAPAWPLHLVLPDEDAGQGLQYREHAHEWGWHR